MNKIIALLAPLALLVSACVKDLDYDFDDVEPHVVVMSTVDPDTTLSLRLSFSRFFLSAEPFRKIEDATLQLVVNGQPQALNATQPNPGDYRLAYRPQYGDRLDLTVQVPGHEPVSASTVVPHPASVTGARASLHHASGVGDNVYAIRFTLHDPADEDNYYFLRLIEELDHGSMGHNYRYTNFSCSDYLLTQGVDLGTVFDNIDGSTPTEHYVDNLPFPDDNIAGRSHEVEIKVEKNYNTSGFILELVSLSRDRYLYELTANQYTDAPFESLIAEPVQVHTNIDGGIGIFAARTRTLVPIPLPQ